MSPATALVTGAGSGIGAAVAMAVAREGAKVAALDVDGSRLEELLTNAKGAGVSGLLGIEVDVADEAAIGDAVRQCQAELGVPTRVLANAGIELNAAAHELPLERWHEVLQVNLTGTFVTARYAIAAMLDSGVSGSVVCTSSPAAFVGFAGGGNSAYAASKGGISALVRSLALDYADAGIRVNAVVPGATDTPLLTAQVPPTQQDEVRRQLVEQAKRQIPLGRLATPAEIAAAVLWLWSDAASYVTGTHLVCDGGLMAKSANTF